MKLSRILAIAAAALLAPLAARAGAVDVNPVLVALSRSEQSAVVTVRNHEKEPSRYQIALYAWDQSASGEMKLTDTQEVVAFPRILTIPPGEAKIVRVGTTVPFGAVERSYRLFIEEMPPPAKPDAPSRVQVLSRIGIPIFLAPDQVIEKVAVGDVRVKGGSATFALQNIGNVRVRPTAVRLVAEDAGGKPVYEKNLDAWYVLAKSAREYAVSVPAESCAKVRSVSVEVALQKEVLRGREPTPQGACAVP